MSDQAPRASDRDRVQFLARYSPKGGGLFNRGERASLPRAEAADVVQRKVAVLDPLPPLTPLPPEDKALSQPPLNKMLTRAALKRGQ